VIGAKTLVTLTLLALGVIAAATFGVLTPERLFSRGAGTLFFLGLFAVVVGTLMFRFWRLGEPSLHYFRVATKRDHWSSEEAHFVGGDERRITLGDNRGEAFDLGPRLHRVVCVALALLLGLACIDARALGLLDRFRASMGKAGATYCPDPETQPQASADPNVPGCELMRRAYALGYVKSLGQCAPQQQQRASAAPPCTRRQRDEPALHYAWRLLNRTWSSVRAHTGAGYLDGLKRDFGTRVDHVGELGRAEEQMLASAPRASHHLWTNLPDPGDDDGLFRKCNDRYLSMPHRPMPTGERRASKVLKHVLGQLLFESRYEPAAGSCREYHVHWGAPLDTCRRLAANPEAVLSSASALSDVKLALERQRLTRERALRAAPNATVSAMPPSSFISFQCYFEDVAAAPTSTPFTFAGQSFAVEELHVPPSPAGATLYIDRYDAVARLLVPGFHYGALLSEAGVEAGAGGGLQAAFAGHDYLLTRLYGLDALDIYLDAGWIASRPDLLEVYPYERHLRNYVEIFRRQYARVRGRL
jgi:hypothetical protein